MTKQELDKLDLDIRNYIFSNTELEDGEINDITNKIMSLITPYIKIDYVYNPYLRNQY